MRSISDFSRWAPCFVAGLLSVLPASAGSAQNPPPNRLTAEEVAAGWKLLFDGTLDGWRGYRREEVPPGWQARDGALVFDPGSRGGTIITVDRYADFELALEWRIAEGGNSGIFYRATEDEVQPYWTGPEMQILDNAGHRDGATPETSAGSNYALHAPTGDVTRPVGEWNEVRIIVRGAQVEHWMNGVRIVAYELWTDEWRAMVRRSKFGEWPGYGMAPAGHIGLQDHGDPVWFRNIRIRELEPASVREQPASVREQPASVRDRPASARDPAWVNPRRAS